MDENDSAGTPSVRRSQRSEITLLPDDQWPDRKARREPIFGAGAGPFLAELIISIVALGLVLLVLLLAHSLKEKATGLIFGGSQRPPPIESVRQVDEEQRIQVRATDRIAVAMRNPSLLHIRSPEQHGLSSPPRA